MEQSRAVDAAPTGSGGRTLPAPRSRWAWIGAGVGLAALAYRPLLVFPSSRSLPEDLEAWFFVPSQTMGPVV